MAYLIAYEYSYQPKAIKEVWMFILHNLADPHYFRLCMDSFVAIRICLSLPGEQNHCKWTPGLFIDWFCLTLA